MTDKNIKAMIMAAGLGSTIRTYNFTYAKTVDTCYE